MALFNRNKQDETEEVPSEIQEYYQAERRERTWVAWVLALGTLVATVLLALGLYFGGRWVYRQVFNSNNETSQTEQTEEATEESTDSPAALEEVNEPTPVNETPVPPTQPAQQNQPTSTQPTSSGSTPSTSTTPSTTTTPSTGPLPSTGPSHVLAVFVITTVTAAVLHRLFAQKRLDS